MHELTIYRVGADEPIRFAAPDYSITPQVKSSIQATPSAVSGQNGLDSWGGRYTGARRARRRSRAKVKWEMSAGLGRDTLLM